MRPTEYGFRFVPRIPVEVKAAAVQENPRDKCWMVSFSSGSGLRVLRFRVPAVTALSSFLASAKLKSAVMLSYRYRCQAAEVAWCCGPAHRGALTEPL